MPKHDLLLFSSDSEELQDYANALQGFGFTIHLCSNSEAAQLVLDSHPVRAILVLKGSTEDNMDALLKMRMLQHPLVPIFYVSASGANFRTKLLEKARIMIVPPKVGPEIIDKLLAPLTDLDSTFTGTQLRREHTILMPPMIYPIIFREAKSVFEAEFVLRALRRFHGNVSRTAVAIDMARRNLQNKIQDANIDLAALRKVW